MAWLISSLVIFCYIFLSDGYFRLKIKYWWYWKHDMIIGTAYINRNAFIQFYGFDQGILNNWTFFIKMDFNPSAKGFDFV